MGIEVLYAINDQFEPFWRAYRMNDCAAIGTLNRVMQPDVETYSELVLDYARKNNKSLAKKLRTGVVSIALLVSTDAETDEVDPGNWTTRAVWLAGRERPAWTV